MPRLRVSRGAGLDLVEIFAYIAKDNLTAARRMNAKFAQVFETIAQQPGIGRERPELDAGLRSLPVGSYVIYYKQSREFVKILRIIHGARDVRNLK